MRNLRIGGRLLRAEWKRLVRQSVAASLFVGFIVTMFALNMSFNATFHDAQQKSAQGTLILDRDGFRFMLPPDEWVWNSTQVVLNQATLKLLEPLRDGFAALTIGLGMVVMVREVHESYKEAKRDNDEHSAVMGTFYALGIRRSGIYGIFMLEKLVAFGAGWAGGLLLSVWVIVPLIMGRLASNEAGLFFQHIDYGIAGVAGGMFVALSVTVKSLVLCRGTRVKAMVNSVREIT